MNNNLEERVRILEEKVSAIENKEKKQKKKEIIVTSVKIGLYVLILVLIYFGMKYIIDSYDLFGNVGCILWN